MKESIFPRNHFFSSRKYIITLFQLENDIFKKKFLIKICQWKDFMKQLRFFFIFHHFK